LVERWGSCTAKGHISLNWKLIEQPDFVLDYVILHELVHTVELNHSKRFWEKLRKVCPRADEGRKWLRGKRLGEEI
jgi:predicted metal-dependent hydrolase